VTQPPTFQEGARVALQDAQLRRNLRAATHTIRAKRAAVVAELPDWEELRAAGRDIKAHTMRHLDRYLLELEASVQRAGGQVHWAADADSANRLVIELVRRAQAREVVKVKSITNDEIGLNAALEGAGIVPIETDLAELIIQLAGESSSHILVPAIHKNRAEIRQIFEVHLGIDVPSDEPEALAEVARQYLRRAFLRAQVGISGANFAIAETGSVAIFESEGNGRMCLTLPRVLITVMGIEKVIPRFRDLEVFAQLLPRSSTGERMNPYTSIWTGVHQGDGPEDFHLILLDNGRTSVLADELGRQALHCIRCSACLNVCPVYERTGGHAYHSVYPGPIGAILTPQLIGVDRAPSLPYASTLCGACYDVCPVSINIPEVLTHLRGCVIRAKQKTLRGRADPENAAMQVMARVFRDRRLYERAQRVAQTGQRPFIRHHSIPWLPPPFNAWTAAHDVRPVPAQSFRQWWVSERDNAR
jgi:L-lactate dehydrogenase complex protein LldF